MCENADEERVVRSSTKTADTAVVRASYALSSYGLCGNSYDSCERLCVLEMWLEHAT